MRRLDTDDRREVAELLLGCLPARCGGELLMRGECSSIGSRESSSIVVEEERPILGGDDEVDIGPVLASERRCLPYYEAWLWEIRFPPSPS